MLKGGCNIDLNKIETPPTRLEYSPRQIARSGFFFVCHTCVSAIRSWFHRLSALRQRPAEAEEPLRVLADSISIAPVYYSPDIHEFTGFLSDAAAPSSALILWIPYKVCINNLNWIVKRLKKKKQNENLVVQSWSHFKTPVLIYNHSEMLLLASQQPSSLFPAVWVCVKWWCGGGGPWFPKKDSQGISKYALPRLAKERQKASRQTPTMGCCCKIDGDI